METKHNKARLEQFSDGVFSIAITLLALELHVPRLITESINTSLAELTPLLPNILTFVLSFISIAIFWVNHHQLTHTIGRISRRILWSNILFLLFLTLIPFVTQVVSINPIHPLAVLTYSLILFGASVSFSILRYFIHRGSSVTPIPMRRSFVGPLFYLLAVVSALFSVWIAYLFLLIPPLFYFLPKITENTDIAQ